MTNEERDRDYEVVWSGGEGLAADRESKATSFWSQPKRLYNKKADYWNRKQPKLINPLEDDDYASGQEVVLRDD